MPLSFETWTQREGLIGNLSDLFEAIDAEHGQPNGIVYAMQPNLQSGEPVMVIRVVDGQPCIDIPVQNAATLPFVEVLLEGATNLTDGAWDLVFVPTATQPPAAENRERWTPDSAPGKAFMRVRAAEK